MIQQRAKVTRLIDGSRAEVAVRRQSACGHDCSKCGGGCSELLVQPEVRVIAENMAGARLGDIVTVESSTKDVLGAAFLVYVVPFLLFFTGYFVAGRFAPSGEGVQIGVGSACFLLGFVLAWLLDRRHREHRAIQFRITGVEQGG